MKISFSTGILTTFAVLLLWSPLPASAWDHPQTVRLGQCIIEPGISVIRLKECAGKPLHQQSAANARGQIKETFFYRYHARTAAIHVVDGSVTEIELKD